MFLREVLDRIDLPAAADIPDRAEMARLGLKKWRLPDTEIDIVLIEDGPRAGQYLFSAETLDRLPDFYDRVKLLPDRSKDLGGAAQGARPAHPRSLRARFTTPI